MSSRLKAKLPNPFVLLYCTLKIWAHTLPIFAGLALIGAMFTIAAFAFAFLAWAEGQFDISLAWRDVMDSLTMAAPLIIAHAGFLVISTQIAGRTLDPSIRRMSIGRWLLTSSGVAVLMATILLPVMTLMPRMSVMALTAVFMLTPILPAFIIGGLPHNLSFWAKFLIFSSIAALPWLLVIELLGLPSQVAESFGVMQGGVILIPLTAVHTFLASTLSAIVSAVVFIGLKREGSSVVATEEVGS